MPAPALPLYRYAVTSALAPGWALIASRTCAAVLVGAPSALVASDTVRLFPSAITDSAEPGGPATNSAVMSLPPRWPIAFENSCTA